MIDFRYFTNEAEEDFATAFSLLENSDYKHAVSNIQLALEKYLKAYFIKYGIIENPKEIGHLKYSQIIEKLIQLIQKDSDRLPDNQNVQKSSKLMIGYYILNQKCCQKLEAREDYQIAYWKYSLGIELTKNETNLLSGIVTEFYQIMLNFFIDIGEYLRNSSSNENDATMIKDPKSKEEFASSLVDSFKEINEKGLQNVDPFEMISKLENILKPIMFGNGPNSMNFEDTKFVEKLFPMLRSMQWFDHAYMMYCHRQISQYPMLIDGKYSADLYKEKSENLKIFFNQIRQICDQIKQEIIPN